MDDNRGRLYSRSNKRGTNNCVRQYPWDPVSRERERKRDSQTGVYEILQAKKKEKYHSGTYNS